MTTDHLENVGDLDPYSSPKTFFGAELRRLREAAGLTQLQLGERVFCSRDYISRFESASRRPQPEVSRLLDEVLGSGEHLQRLCRLARRSKHPDYFADAADLEKHAATISEYAPMLIPGLLQTEAYARGLTRATLPYAARDEVQAHVTARMERGGRLDDPGAPELWAILHEAALRVPVDGPEVMREQLDRLVTMGHDHSRVIVQVVPYSAGPHPLMYGTTLLMTFDDAPPVAYTEGAHTGQLIDEPALVAKFDRSYDHVRAAALTPRTSLALIESVAKDYSSP
ncbi:helix-turn-helix transcriptional regulator [Streptomyces sp. S07_1.15]|uniref:helix-turn-helix domain-containing protein n=1 Tax=Streptomyces sp. S07_1.15 TaxID=2873925 RepID=UPI001D1376CA|nr:helix-turn-helix transcriptional regulator [Streptomyces sp. S07_1.15]MCC3655196.1 helix-turn-helix transcriptional regulator [Streptomyces sp. S07_1.15]